MKMIVNRILEQWHPLKLFFTGEVAEQKSLHKSILDTFNNPIFLIYLHFLSYILKLVIDMNLEFQSEDPKIYTLASRLKEMYKTILKTFIKRTVLNSTS